MKKILGTTEIFFTFTPKQFRLLQLERFKVIVVAAFKNFEDFLKKKKKIVNKFKFSIKKNQSEVSNLE